MAEENAAAVALRAQAAALARALGVKFYIRNGRIEQHPPGEMVDPGPLARPQPHGGIGPGITASAAP